jgi:hypothetical protein
MVEVFGLVEVFFYGLYIALVFVPLFNYFEGRRAPDLRAPGTVPREAMAHR